jgi:hypothetical protein
MLKPSSYKIQDKCFTYFMQIPPTFINSSPVLGEFQQIT